MGRWLAWLAGLLEIEEPRRLRLWIWRLFIRPPLPRAAPADSRPVPWLVGWLAYEMGVLNPRNIDDWVTRLFVLPDSSLLVPRPGRRVHVRGGLRTHPAWVGFVMALKAIWHTIVWIDRLFLASLRRATQKLPGFDYVRLGRRLEAAANLQSRLGPWSRGVLIVFAVVGYWLITTTPFTAGEQLLFFLMVWFATLFIRHIEGNLPTLLLISLSIIATSRYAWWRATSTLTLESSLELFFGYLLLAAEMYTWLILFLGYLQTMWPLKRHPAPMPANPAEWPTIDVFIPTYNEPLKVVKPTVLAAQSIDWPRDKIRIYILDDGRRDEFRRFAEEAGVGYIIRPDNKHAKAGNLNHALKVTSGEYVAIFDCDHLPARSFLQVSIGWFLRDRKLAMLQTPHHFFSPDPFERNLDTFRRVPNEGALFYGLIQDGNDFWNATFFCGSCAVIKRGPLLEVGGIAVETVTEDAHTALKLHRLGYTTAYLNFTQAAGLATESLSGHVGQRIRWARGMAQIFRIDNPFFGKGLDFFQRVCYSNAMLHFFYGIPRLIFLLAPLTYLFFEFHIINAAAGVIAAYVLPHIVQANLANSRLQGKYRHSFWAEVYESVLAWYITLPTTVAFINPKHGKFNVTAKGGLVDREYFDWSISKPYVVLVLLNMAGLLIGLGRLFFWNTFESGTVLLNLIWTVYNLFILGAAVGVANEARQVRTAHRVVAHLPATLYLPNGMTLFCHTEDFSIGGVGIKVPHRIDLQHEQRLWVAFYRGGREYPFPARVVMQSENRLGLRFDPLDLRQERELLQCTFARADAWNDWDTQDQGDHPLEGLKEVVSLGVQGYQRLGRRSAEVFLENVWPRWQAAGRRWAQQWRDEPPPRPARRRPRTMF